MVQYYGGVYALCNVETGVAYVGCTNDFALRYRQHMKLLRLGEHSNRALQHDWDRHSTAAFSLAILDRYPLGAEQLNRHSLEAAERRWLARARSVGITPYNDQVGKSRRKAA